MNNLLEKVPTLNQIKNEKARRAQSSLINFTQYTKPEYEVNWHHRNLANTLDKLYNREIKRLMVFMPPRYGKSELVSRRFPAYILGRDPNASVIATSYSAELATSMNRDVQRIIDTDLYRDVFPDTQLTGKNVRSIATKNHLRNSDIFEIVNHEGAYKSAGVGGGITGRGADFAIIDDPIKNRQDAHSQLYRDRLYDWFTSTLYTRLEKDAAVLLTLTRWHEDDLAGRLLQLAENNPDADQWHVISYPALYDETDDLADNTDLREHGEPLWESKYNKKTLMSIKATAGTYEWNALYQQNPTPAEGGIIKRDWFQYYNVPPKNFEEIVQSWDLAFSDETSGSYVVGQVWGKKGANVYLLDQSRKQIDFTQTLEEIRLMTNKWREARRIFIEKKANGAAVINVLKNKIAGIIPVEPQGSKEARAHAVSPFIESGNVYLPNEFWVNEYVNELTAFPNGSSDDQVDTTTQALNKLLLQGKAVISNVNIW